jgi:predicted RNase H-like HicB family nuclease
MKTLIRVYKDGKFYVAEDLVTNVADQGATKEEALAGLKKGLEEHYKILLELAPTGDISLMDIGVEKYATDNWSQLSGSHAPRA